MNLEPLRRRAVRVPGNRGYPPSTAAKDASYLAPLGDLESGHCRLEQEAMGRRDGRRDVAAGAREEAAKAGTSSGGKKRRRTENGAANFFEDKIAYLILRKLKPSYLIF